MEPPFSSNDRKNGLRFPYASLRSPKSDRLLALILDLGSRMGLVVYLGEILEVKVCVYLRSADIGMTEEFLHAPQVMA